VNLNLLPSLVALLSERHVSGAARRAGVTQSAMSHALSKLRILFDDPLFVRSGRELVLTPRGERVAAALPPVLEELSEIIAPPVPFDPETSERSFTLATLDYFELTTLSEVLAHFARVAPCIHLDVERVDSNSPERLRRGEIDLLVAGSSASLPSAGLRSRHFFDDPFRVIMRRDHPLGRRRLTLERYARADHVVVSVEGRRSGVVDRKLAERGFSRRIALRVPHFASAPLAVMRSDLICTIASSVAIRSKELFGVKVMKPPLDIPSAGVVAWWPRQHDDDPACTWFRNELLSGRALSPALRKLGGR
jgi:DNA-binding transcriptional LysR family regulator